MKEEIKKVQFIKNTKLPTEIICIVDRSGSMGMIAKDAIGGLNTVLQGQQDAEGEANLTLVLFDNQYEMVYDRVPISDVPDLTTDTYIPRGSTALNDAIGTTLQDFKERFSKEDRPSQIIVSILTDGEENASQEYSTPQAKSLIEIFQADDYEFVFLASDDIDGGVIAREYNIDPNLTFAYGKSAIGMSAGMADMGKTVAAYRCGVDVKSADLTKDLNTLVAEYNAKKDENLADVVADPKDG